MKMKKADRPPFAKNLSKARKAFGWTQAKAADMLGVTRSAYGSYEEGRAQPVLGMFTTFISVLGISNLQAFIENPDFDYWGQDREYTVEFQSPMEKKYAAAPNAARKIVDLALGIGTEALTC